MLALINRILDWFKSIFWKEEMELTLVGLQYSGKTTFVNVIAVSIYYCSCLTKKSLTNNTQSSVNMYVHTAFVLIGVLIAINILAWVPPTAHIPLTLLHIL